VESISLKRWLGRWPWLVSSRKLRETEQKFQLLLDGAADYAIFMLDTSGNVRSWSTAAQKMFGYTASEIHNNHFSCFYPQNTREAKIPQAELRIAGAHGRHEDTGLRVRKDGTEFWANVVLCPLVGDQGELKGFSNVTRDISERKQAEEILNRKEEELYQARKMEAIGRLAGGVAHDFNNLITGIIGLSEDLRDSAQLDDLGRGDIEEIIKAARRASNLTRQLLAFGRRQISSPQILNLNTIIKDLEKMLRRLLGADVELVVLLGSEIGNVKMDPAHIEQIIINLIMNARDAILGAGCITLETSRSGSSVSLQIRDTGTGMTEETLKHLFEPFYTTKATGKGTGLGLATVYGIVKQNQGDIFVDSRLGAGTTFKILFPETIEKGTATVGGNQNGVSPSTHEEKTLLVVEDEAIVRKAITRALRKGGYQVLTATSAEEAIALCISGEEKIDLLLTDVVLPGMNGQELAGRLLSTYPGLSVLYMSGYSENVIAHRGILEPGIHFIEKSFTSQSLLEKVRFVLNSSHPLPSSSPSTHE